MAKIIAGFGSSHSPLMSLTTGELWETHARNDPRNRELVQMPAGKRVTYDQLLAGADTAIATMINREVFDRRIDALQDGMDELQRRFVDTKPDVVVMFGDDQSEFFFDDNYPMINVYWGEKIRMVPRPVREDMSESQKVTARAYGTEDRDYPCDRNLGLHIIESLVEQDFDIAHTQYQKEEYGGGIGPATWYLDMYRETKPRRFGLPHAFAFPIVRWFGDQEPPIVPITINTCYPPNWISPRRAYALGKAVRKAVEEWDSDLTVAMACSGGLSHFVVDEELDRLALKGLSEADETALTSLPRHRLQSATTETLNWVATAGAMHGTPMEVIAYEPGYRTPAGTGCGCAVGHWHD
jgi:Catalytic LigB subunit of aromatic ring-opening dioxygenase